jgi:hypothetical protein
MSIDKRGRFELSEERMLDRPSGNIEGVLRREIVAQELN